jgi:Zn-dependent alcohol dehydrogenase
VSCYSGVIPVQDPITLGHEIAGDKEEVGENVKISKR